VGSSADELKVIFRAEVDRAVQDLKRFSKSSKETHSDLSKMAVSMAKWAAGPLLAFKSTEKIIALGKDFVNAYAKSTAITEENRRALTDLSSSYNGLKEAGGRFIVEAGGPLLTWMSDAAKKALESANGVLELKKATDSIQTKGLANAEAKEAVVYLAEQQLATQKLIDEAKAYGSANADVVAIFSEQLESIKYQLRWKQEQFRVEEKQRENRELQNQSEKEAEENAKKALENAKKISAQFDKGQTGETADAIDVDASRYMMLIEEEEKARKLANLQTSSDWEILSAQYDDTQKQMTDTMLEQADARKAAAAAEAESIKAALSGAYSEIASSAMWFWGMSNKMSNQAAEQEIANMREQLSALEETYDSQLSLKEQLSADTSEFESQYAEKKAALEEQIARKEDALKRREFEQEKKMNIAQTIMSGAEAAIKAWTAGPFAGPALSALITSLTVAKVAMIQAQKYPALAEGGIVQPSPGGSLVRVAEAGKPELVMPLDKAGFGSTTVIINGVVGDRDAVVAWVAEGIKRGRKTGTVGI